MLIIIYKSIFKINTYKTNSKKLIALFHQYNLLSINFSFIIKLNKSTELKFLQANKYLSFQELSSVKKTERD